MTIKLCFYGHDNFNLEISERNVFTECTAWAIYRNEIREAIRKDFDAWEQEEYFGSLLEDDFPNTSEIEIANTFSDLKDTPNLLSILKKIMNEVNSD